MQTLLRLQFAIFLTGLGILFTLSCRPRVQDNNSLFVHEVPQNREFKDEVKYLEKTARLTPEDRAKLEEDIEKAQQKIGVPKGLLWCLLFQESRFDPLKNAGQESGARGMGQFTQAALDEINEDTDNYDEKTAFVLNSVTKPRRLPLTFELRPNPQSQSLAQSLYATPEQAKTSYFNPRTAIFASAAYLNNRYNQIKSALDQKDMIYDPQILWMYAAAAYNKGARTVFTLLSHQRIFGGESSVSELLMSPKLSYALLTHEDMLEFSLRELWTGQTRRRYIKELSLNMKLVLSCVLPEARL
jgi:hypothetical protein